MPWWLVQSKNVWFLCPWPNHRTQQLKKLPYVVFPTKEQRLARARGKQTSGLEMIIFYASGERPWLDRFLYICLFPLSYSHERNLSGKSLGELLQTQMFTLIQGWNHKFWWSQPRSHPYLKNSYTKIHLIPFNNIINNNAFTMRLDRCVYCRLRPDWLVNNCEVVIIGFHIIMHIFLLKSTQHACFFPPQTNEWVYMETGIQRGKRSGWKRRGCKQKRG